MIAEKEREKERERERDIYIYMIHSPEASWLSFEGGVEGAMRSGRNPQG